MNTAVEEKSSLDALFAAIDRKDTDAFVSGLTEDASFRFGNAPELRGRDAIRDGVNGFFATIASSKHRLDRVIGQDQALVCEGVVNYKRLDGREVTVPFVDVFDYEGNKISAYRIYIDISPLYAE